MSMKITIPEVSPKYKKALITYLLDLPRGQRKDFYKHLNLISGYCQSVEISLEMDNIGGIIPLKELLNKSKGFKLATIKEFAQFHKDGYSGGDFQHIFFNAFLSVMFDIVYTGE